MADDNKTEKVEVDNRPTSQKDLEARLANGFGPERLDNSENDVLNPEKVNAPYATKDMDTSGYLGVSSEYMQYASDVHKPLTATEGPEAESLKLLQGGVAGVRKTVPVDNTPATEVGVGDRETVNTVTSGEGYSAKLVDAPKDFQGPAVIGLPEQEPKATAAPTPTAPVKAAKPTPPKS